METTAPGVYRTFDDLYPIVTTRVSRRCYTKPCCAMLCFALDMRLFAREVMLIHAEPWHSRRCVFRGDLMCT